MRFAIYLDVDNASIQQADRQQRLENKASSILAAWHKGSGNKPRTWAAILTALQNARMSDLASEIQANLERGFQPKCDPLSRDLMEPISTGETFVPHASATDKTAATYAGFSSSQELTVSAESQYVNGFMSCLYHARPKFMWYVRLSPPSLMYRSPFMVPE